MPFAIMLAACLTACEKAPNGYEVDEDAVVLEAYGPNPVLRGSDLTFIGQNLDRITATRDTDRTYAFIYTERGKPVDVDLTAIGTGENVRAWWFDPRSGRCMDLGLFRREKSVVFTPLTKGTGNDWVLVIDAPEAGYPEPGAGPQVGTL